MPLLDTWDPQTGTVHAAVLPILAAAARLGLDRRPWSLCELRLAESDVERLESWLRDLRPGAAAQLLREDRTHPGEILPRAAQCGLVVLIVVSERARRSCVGHQVWPALAGVPFVAQETRQLLLGDVGQPTSALRGAIELAVAWCRLRNALHDDEGHRWYRTVRLQYGYSEPALVVGLAQRLYGPQELYLEPVLSGGMVTVFDTLRRVHQRHLSPAVARAQLSESPWILPAWIDRVVAAAVNLAFVAALDGTPDEDEAVGTARLLAEPVLVWEGPAPRFRSSAEVGVTTTDQPRLTLLIQGEPKLHWLRQPDGAYAPFGREQDVELPPSPAVTATLVTRDGSIVGEQTLELWDDEAPVVGYALGGTQVPIGELRAGQGTALLLPETGVTVVPTGDPAARIATRVAHRYSRLPLGLTVRAETELVLELRATPVTRRSSRLGVSELTLEVMRSGAWQCATEGSSHEARDLRSLPWRVLVPPQDVDVLGSPPTVSLLAGPHWIEQRRSRPRGIGPVPGVGEWLEAVVDRPFNYQAKRGDPRQWVRAGRIVDHGRLRGAKLSAGRRIELELTEDVADHATDFLKGTEVVVLETSGGLVSGQLHDAGREGATYVLDHDVVRPRAVLLRYGTARLGAYWWQGWFEGLDALEPRRQATLADAIWGMRLPLLLDPISAALRAAVARAPEAFLGAWLRPAPELGVTTIEGATWTLLLRSLLFEGDAASLLRAVESRASRVQGALGDPDAATSVLRLGAVHPRLGRALLRGILTEAPAGQRRGLLRNCRQRAIGLADGAELDESALRLSHETLQANFESPPGVDPAYARRRIEAVARGERIGDWPGTHAVLRASTAQQLALSTALQDLV
jgi:hypothetical protein